jgi:transposase-like protein
VSSGCNYGILSPSLLIIVIAAEIISHSVWLYFRFALSFRDVEEILAKRGVVLTYETVCTWCLKFGQTYAQRLTAEISAAGRQVVA